MSYIISVGGLIVDFRSIISFNIFFLIFNFNVIGLNNVKYRVIINTEVYIYIVVSRVFLLYVKFFVFVEDIKKMEEKIVIVWK